MLLTLRIDRNLEEEFDGIGNGKIDAAPLGRK